MKNAFIYALCEPGTRMIRYIGKTSCPERRLKEHWKRSQYQDSHLGHWLASLAGTPSLLVLKEVPEAEWQEWECCYIHYARLLGFNLVNGTDGGEGFAQGRKLTPAHRLKIRVARTGTKHSAATREKMSVDRTGSKNLMFGKTQSAASKLKNREWHLGKEPGNKGKSPSQETLIKQSLGQQRRRKLERLEKLFQKI